MAIKNGEWIMRGMEWDDPARIQSWEELIRWIHEIGFLPLFKNEINGFSVEENTVDLAWWTGDPNQDPWEWRALIARSGRVAYGKFFGKRAGFISKAWFLHFANWRRDGYDFDSRWEDERATMRQKRIMDRFWELYISRQEVHLHGEISPPSRETKSTVTEKESTRSPATETGWRIKKIVLIACGFVNTGLRPN